MINPDINRVMENIVSVNRFLLSTFALSSPELSPNHDAFLSKSLLLMKTRSWVKAVILNLWEITHWRGMTGVVSG